MIINTTWLLYALSVVFGIVGLYVFTRKESKIGGFKKNYIALVSGLLAVALILGQMGYLSALGITLSAGTIQDTGVAKVITPLRACGVEDTTVTLSAVDIFSSVATGGVHRYSINGDPALTVNNAGTFTASPGDIVKVLFNNGTVGNSYYSSVVEEQIPCKGTVTLSDKLYQNGTMTMNIFDRYSDVINGNAVNETIGAGDSTSLKVELNAQNKRGFPYGGVLVLEYNSSDFDEMTLSSTEVTVTKRTSVPSVYKTSSVDNIAVAYEIGAMTGSAIKKLTLNYDADDTENPGNLNDPVLTFYSSNYFVNEDNGGAFEGPAVEDEDNTRTYGHTTSATLSVN